MLRNAETAVAMLSRTPFSKQGRINGRVCV